jgi:hypothetical protein
MKRLTVLALVCAACASRAEIALNPDVTPDTLATTICVPGYTSTVRPPVYFTNRIKFALMAQSGIAPARALEFELDHRIPLTLGGNPSSPDNLWLQSWEPSAEGWTGANSAKVKDKLEVRLNRLVCAGVLPLAEAQQCIYADWQACALAHPSSTGKGSK